MNKFYMIAIDRRCISAIELVGFDCASLSSRSGLKALTCLNIMARTLFMQQNENNHSTSYTVH